MKTLIASDAADSERLRSMARELRDYLSRLKASIDEELRTYPTPIPRCDAQFNHLYEQRSRLSRIVDRFDAALARGGSAGGLAGAIGEFAEAPSFGESPEEEALRKRAGVSIRSTQ